MNDLKWSKTEKEAARRAFNAAYARECDTIKAKLAEMIDRAAAPKDLWQIHDYLTNQRRRIDEKYDYRYSTLHFLFARLLNEEWIDENDLEGLKDDKIQLIIGIANLGD
jgi:hypothetical protein